MLRLRLIGPIDHSALWIPYIVYLLFRSAHLLLEVPPVRIVQHAVCHLQLDRAGLGAA